MMVKCVALIMLVLVTMTCSASADSQFSLVSPEWVSAHANDPNVRILDVRADMAQYFRGHVPNAVNMADNTLRGPKEGMPVQHLPAQMQADLLSRAGVKDGQTVVVYSDGENVLGATMVAYVLEKLGHSDVRLMDGGWSDYQESRPVSQKYPAYREGTLGSHENRRIAADLNVVKRAANNPKVVLIDARPPAAYAGRITTWMRNGHIPGAINIDWHTLVEPGNAHQIRPIADLQAIYDAKGIKKTDDIILYCGTSREATLEYAVMKHLLGYRNVRLYEGSWTEYCSRPELPIKTGDEP